MGHGEGHGEGQGGGAGGDTGANVAAGSGVAVGVTICMCVCGIPMIVAGVVLINIGLGVLHTIGVVLIILSTLFLVVGVILTILICCGACTSQNSVQPHAVGAGTIIVSQQQQQQQPGMFMTPQSGYPQQQQGGYPMGHGSPNVPQPGYAPAPQTGGNYPMGPQPNQQAGYPTNQPAAYGAPPEYSASANAVQQPGAVPDSSKASFPGPSAPPPATYN
ncbi:hypothetical protein CAPTEDRAFT_227662 [Capitella teleta]|uniref:Uncharacterized protein n=1 Tax=Capitella teleta TaxID=283909 RepID=R7US85_CAPTE|nr:hypothetical protein CAPTEDRAFT_227662 [Capitella teleta]|eukprot:ELU06782.1 hypothetical protein CAPTEDRAFT_227662 [Capitella teleta]